MPPCTSTTTSALRRILLRRNRLSRLLPTLKPPPIYHPIHHAPIRAHTTHFQPSSSPSSAADPSEIDHFTHLAATWWDPHGPSRILHLMNPIRLQFLRRCLTHSRTPPKDLTYLDVGCGGGILSESLARLPGTSSVTAIDPTPATISIAQSHLRTDPPLFHSKKLTYLNTTIQSLPGTPEYTSFDVITAMEVIEHVPDPAAFLKECAARVKPGGWIVMSTIARHWVSWVTTKVLAEGVLRIVPWGTHDWGKYVNAPELEGWVRGLERKVEDGGLDGWKTGDVIVMGCVYVPGVGWREVRGGEKVGNYFVGVRRAPVEE